MFLTTERNYIIEQIRGILAQEDYPRTTITAYFINTNFAVLLKQGDATVLATHGVDLCERDGFQHDPPWMELLFKTFNLIDVNPKVAEIWTRVKSNPQASVNPVTTTRLNSGYPFVNRTTLRTLLDKLAQPQAKAKPILLVNGEAKSGKSYSTSFIDHFTLFNDIVVFTVKIEPGKELEKGATEIALDLVSYMGLETNDIPLETTNLKRYIGELATWVARKANQLETHSWFVFDNFNIQGLRPDAVDFLIAFSDILTKGVYPLKLKMIIISFERARLSVDPGRIDEEEIKACNIQDIDAAIAEIILGVKPAPKPETVQAIHDYVKSGLPEPPSKMGELNQRLRNLIIAVPGVEKLIRLEPQLEYDIVLPSLLIDLPAGPASEKELSSKLSSMELNLQAP